MDSHILVIDDDLDTRDLYCVLLQMAGYRVSAAASIRAAVAGARAVRPDLILTDWMLPDGTAHALCEALEGDPGTQNIPKLAVTGLSLDEDELAFARAAGCERVMLKPVSPDALLAGIASALQAVAKAARSPSA